MKLHVIVENGKVVGVAPAAAPSEPGVPGLFRGGLLAGPNQKLHEIEAPEGFSPAPNPEELHERLAAHLAKK